MKSIKKTILTAILVIFWTFTCSAQSAVVQKVAKSVFTLTTFNKDGSILASSHGVFIGNNGEAVSSWTPFKGADHAIVVDANGNKMDVKALIGANELYDVCKFTVNGNTTPTALASNATSGKVFIIGYSIKKANIKTLNIKSVEKFMTSYNYYILAGSSEDSYLSCPLANAQGQVIGIIQKSNNGELHATDARLAEDMQTNGFSINDPVLRTSNIRAALPKKEDQALLAMMMSSEQTDSIKHAQYVDEFIQMFPTSSEGYTTKALGLISKGDFATADNLMQTCVNKAAQKDEAHSNYAKVIYQKELYSNNKPFAAWNLDKALDEANKAYEINPLDVYRHQQAQIIFSKGEYQKAYDMFITLTKTKLRNGELYYEAAQSKTQLKAPQTEIMTLLDSAIAACPQPLTAVAAPYVLARGMAYDSQKQYRMAIKDYNDYDSLMLGRPISSAFYYTRYKCELQIRQYQQALDDIARSIILTPNEPTYYAEMASLQLRVKEYDRAVKSATRCTQMAPEYPDAYLILGLAQKELGKKEDARNALLKAKELGDKRAEGYLKKL